MSDPIKSRDLPLNPNFGKGVFRRRVRLAGEPGRVIAEVEDCYHGFRAVLHHDGERVTAIDAETLRFPLSTCSGAVGPLQDLVGTMLTAATGDITSEVNPRANCTHLYDLTLLAIKHSLRGTSVRQFDITIPDEKDGPTEVMLTLNHEPLLQWQVYESTIQDEGPLYGLTLGKGFSQWARRIYQGDELEAATILQRGYFVSGARRFDVRQLEGVPVTETDTMLGACYSYTPGRVEHAIRAVNNTRDFTDTPEQLLTFK